MSTSAPPADEEPLTSLETSQVVEIAPQLLDEPAPTDARPSTHLVFGIVSIALFMATVDSTIVATALTTIHRSLHASVNWAGWTITIYSLSSIVASPIAGRLSDQLGRRKLFLYGIVVFTVASMLCGFATDIYFLIVCRAVQAIGGGALQPAATGLFAEHFGRNRDRAIGMIANMSQTGQIAGPLLGGLIVGYLSWRWIFFVNGPIGLLLVVLIVRFLPDSPVRSSTKMDLPGLVLMSSFVLALIYGISTLGNAHVSLYAPQFLGPELMAVVLLTLLVRHTRRASDPFIPMRLIRARGFAAMNIQSVIWGVSAAGVSALVPLYAQQRYHLHVLSAGTLLTARSVTLMLVGTVAAFMLRRTGYRLPMMLGGAVVALGLLMMSIAPPNGIGPYLWLSISAGVTGVGFGLGAPAGRNACLQLAPEQAAAITGLRTMFISVGGIVGVSVTTAVISRSSTPGLAQAHVYWLIAALLVLIMIPVISRVPEHKGSW